MSSLSQAFTFDIFKRFSIDNPLSYKSINSITQDNDGYIWLGSQEGLHRYDGYTVITYLHDEDNSFSLSSDVISFLLADSRERLWIGTREGVNLYDPFNNSFIRIGNHNINSILEDRRGNIWLGTESGVKRLIKQNGKWTTDDIVLDQQTLAINTLMQVETGDIWMGANGSGVHILDENGNYKEKVDFSDISQNPTFAKLVNELYQDSNGNIWVGTFESGLIKIEFVTGNKVHFIDSYEENNSISSKTIEFIHQDSNENIWVATDKGLSVYSANNEKFIKVNHSNTNMSSLSSDYILSIFEDNNKMVWVATISGVNRWDPNLAAFYQYDKNNEFSLSSKLITSFSQHNGQSILVSAYDGEIFSLDTTTKHLTRLLTPKELGNIRISALLSEGDVVWIGTRSSGLLKYQLSDKSLTSYTFNQDNNNSISANSITDIYKDSQNRLWVSTFHNGLNLWLNNGSFKRYLAKDPIDSSSLSISHILQIEEDSQGDIWLATYGGGLNKLTVSTGKITHLKHEPNNKHSISSDLAWIMHFDNQGNLWSGSQAGGINYLSAANINARNYEFKHLNIKDGMKDQTVYGIVQDDNNNIWFSSNNGISRYSPQEKSFKNFDYRHGLTDLEFNHAAIFKAQDNTLYFGSARGFNGISPNQLIENQPAPVVRLNNIYKLNEPVTFKQPLSNLDVVTFDYQDQLISFEYVGLNYSDPNATEYKYRLSGFDHEWIDAGKLRRATYTNLPAGNYTFKVIAANSDNVWSDEYQLKVVILPAPWNTWWAYLIYAFGVALILLFYSRLMNRKLVIEQQQKQYFKQQVIDKTERYVQQNVKLEQANSELEKSAIIDKVTGVKSRRYLDIYIEQTSRLLTQIHNNLLPVQRSLLPQLYILMVHFKSTEEVTNGKLINLAELLNYSRNKDDIVVRWSENTFAIIGYEKDNKATELAMRISYRFEGSFKEGDLLKIVYSYFPFNLEHPLLLNWDQTSVLSETALNLINDHQTCHWMGIHGAKLDYFNYTEAIKSSDLSELEHHVNLRRG